MPMLAYWCTSWSELVMTSRVENLLSSAVANSLTLLVPAWYVRQRTLVLSQRFVDIRIGTVVTSNTV